MFPYWLLFSTFAFGALGYTRRGYARNPSPAIYLAVVGVILFVGLRHEVGTDWGPYTQIFDATRHLDLEDLLTLGDPGFYALIWLVHELELDLWALNLVCATIFSLGLLAFARQQPNPWLAVAVAVPYLVIVIAMSGTRQATAIGFIFFGLTALARGSLFRCIAWIIVAMLFHASAVLLIPIAALSYTRSRAQAALLLLAAAVPAYYVLSASLDVYIDRYSDVQLQTEGTIYRLLLNALPATVFMLMPSRFEVLDHQRRFWRNIAMIALLSIPLLWVLPSSTALDRVSLYVIPLQVLVLSRLPTIGSRNPRDHFLTVAGLVAFLALVLFVFLRFSAHAEYWVPYRSYLTG